MVKAMVTIVLLAGIGLAVVYFAGGYSAHDPDAVGREAKQSITPGMTWQQVVDVATRPERYCVFKKEKRRVAGKEVEQLRKSMPLDFEQAMFAREFAAGNMNDGFTFHYRFSHQVAFEVFFDSAGRVEAVQNLATVANLLDTRRDDE
ncbi:MAG TPA: hypothetical protein PKC49_00820 [Phycisphaerae bacterium]|nr:hypothetical protein [Phycisphaerae bacterium]